MVIMSEKDFKALLEGQRLIKQEIDLCRQQIALFIQESKDRMQIMKDNEQNKIVKTLCWVIGGLITLEGIRYIVTHLI